MEGECALGAGVLDGADSSSIHRKKQFTSLQAFDKNVLFADRRTLGASALCITIYQYLALIIVPVAGGSGVRSNISFLGQRSLWPQARCSASASNVRICEYAGSHLANWRAQSGEL